MTDDTFEPHRGCSGHGPCPGVDTRLFHSPEERRADAILVGVLAVVLILGFLHFLSTILALAAV